MLLCVLGFSQQVGERQRLQGARARGSGIPERVGVPRVPPTPHRAQRARPHAARRVDAVDADHVGEVRVQSDDSPCDETERPRQRERLSTGSGKKTKRVQTRIWAERRRPPDDLQLRRFTGTNCRVQFDSAEFQMRPGNWSDSTLTTLYFRFWFRFWFSSESLSKIKWRCFQNKSWSLLLSRLSRAVWARWSSEELSLLHYGSSLFIMHKNTAAIPPAHRPAGWQPAARALRCSEPKPQKHKDAANKLMITETQPAATFSSSETFYNQTFIFRKLKQDSVDSTETMREENLNYFSD